MFLLNNYLFFYYNYLVLKSLCPSEENYTHINLLNIEFNLSILILLSQIISHFNYFDDEEHIVYLNQRNLKSL